MSPAILFLGPRASAPTSIDATARTQVFWRARTEDDEPSAAERLCFPCQSDDAAARCRDSEVSVDPRRHHARAFQLSELTPEMPVAIARASAPARSWPAARVPRIPRAIELALRFLAIGFALGHIVGWLVR